MFAWGRGPALIFEPERSLKRAANSRSNIYVDDEKIAKSRPKVEILLDVRYKLEQARQTARTSRDETLLYFVDMAILHVDEVLIAHLNLRTEDHDPG
jgi:hypothetical protein